MRTYGVNGYTVFLARIRRHRNHNEKTEMKDVACLLRLSAMLFSLKLRLEPPRTPTFLSGATIKLYYFFNLLFSMSKLRNTAIPALPLSYDTQRVDEKPEKCKEMKNFGKLPTFSPTSS